MFPQFAKATTSWEGHLSGAIAGILCAIGFMGQGPQRPDPFAGEEEEEENEEESEEKEEEKEGTEDETRLPIGSYHFYHIHLGTFLLSSRIFFIYDTL